ncbi:hypothetical protein CEXT_475761 [Caerostris extrusa]|uniref:Uncharacterized protein n=1 Tax=Caerostris extrusa TaxID=172846 RepID=A0AAV4XG58_CAEEX|nr:hypothetical protein CEXT_475761 [Caerostris extrusa]
MLERAETHKVARFCRPPPAGAAIAISEILLLFTRDAPLLQRPLTPSIMVRASITLLVLLSWCRHAFATCPECAVSDQQQATRLKLEAIKQQILSKLHLQDRPNITSSGEGSGSGGAETNTGRDTGGRGR